MMLSAENRFHNFAGKAYRVTEMYTKPGPHSIFFISQERCFPPGFYFILDVPTVIAGAKAKYSKSYSVWVMFSF